MTLRGGGRPRRRARVQGHASDGLPAARRPRRTCSGARDGCGVRNGVRRTARSRNSARAVAQGPEGASSHASGPAAEGPARAPRHRLPGSRRARNAHPHRSRRLSGSERDYPAAHLVFERISLNIRPFLGWPSKPSYLRGAGSVGDRAGAGPGPGQGSARPGSGPRDPRAILRRSPDVLGTEGERHEAGAPAGGEEAGFDLIGTSALPAAPGERAGRRMALFSRSGNLDSASGPARDVGPPGRRLPMRVGVPGSRRAQGSPGT